jgi:hypothetical protein
MASLITGYEYDIFISYRQMKNKCEKWAGLSGICSLLFILIALASSLLISCNKEQSENWLTSGSKQYTIPEIYDLIGLDQYGCNDTMDCEGKYVNVTGYINGINVFPDESRLLLYSEKSYDISEVLNQTLINVKVGGNENKNFFSNIVDMYSNLPDSAWKKVSIKAEIYGWTMYGNGWCKKAIGLIGYKIKIEN